ncbi:MAG: ImmA/IrrE family metallo-endopeptidase [Bacteroidetes bacterium]|nr:ImmA/IrrE family metallo-endopeptidase [Bacteroidota bacterium]
MASFPKGIPSGVRSKRDKSLKRKLLSPPGDTIQETIDTIGMSQFELAERMGKNKKNINQIIKGKEPITQNTALQLERVLGIPASFWIEREKEYRQEIASIEAEEALAGQREWLREFPLKAMKEFGWIPAVTDEVQLLKEMLTFFGIASPQQWREIYINHSLTVSFRMSLAHTSSPGALSAWLRKGELQAQETKRRAYNQTRFVESLDNAKPLVASQPDDFKEKLQKICADAGVAVVYTRCLPKVTASGASRWIKSSTTPLIQLSGRYKTNDHFWFSFYHEAGHILKHGKKEVFLEEVKGAKIDKKKEKEADSFASEMLFPSKAFKKLLSEPTIDENVITSYAREYHTHPAIIAGRLEYNGVCHPSLFRHLKVAIQV